MFDQVLSKRPLKGVVKWETKIWETFGNLAKFVYWPKFSRKCDLSKSVYRYPCLCSTFQKRSEYVSKLFWKRVNKNSLTWWYIFKTSWRELFKMFWRSLEDVFKISWRHLEDVLKTFLQDVLKTFWRRISKTVLLA